MLKCADCGKTIQNPHYLNGKAYGYGCYKKQLALLYKKFEDEKNAEYAKECFAAMQIFERKKSNSFHDSICKQWNEYKKLTGKQLSCIKKGFTPKEKIDFWCIWFTLTEDRCTKTSISQWIRSEMFENRYVADYINNEAVINCILYDSYYKNGFYFYHDKEDLPNEIHISAIKYLEEDLEDEYIEVLKVVK